MGLAALHVVADGVHQVGLAHADAAVEEERVVGLGRALGDGLGGCHGELVPAADDEGIELIARVQLRRGAPVKPGLLGRRPGGCAGLTAELVPYPALAWRALAMAGHGGKATVFAHLGGRAGPARES